MKTTRKYFLTGNYHCKTFLISALVLIAFLLKANEVYGYERPLPDSYRNVKKPFILVLDAGHGGKDGGTMGKFVKEKDIALQITMGLGEKIKQSLPDVQVIYTRNDDTFIPLFERVQIANEAHADLFISIHCNASKNKLATGTETYVMGLHTADENLETAKRENASILLESNFEENYDGFDPHSDAGHIILSMYQNLYLDKSIELATLVEDSFGLKTSRGVKQAGFVVLRRATMPSVLVETGFLSNPEEEKVLRSKEGQERIINGLFKAFKNYKGAFDNQNYAIQGNREPMVIPISLPSKIINSTEIYSVQIAATSQLNKKAFSNVPDLKVIFIDNFYKYYSGIYSDKEEASKARETLINKGYKSAFIVSDPLIVQRLTQKD